MTPISCAGCGRTFTPRRSTATYCGVKCRVSVFRRRARPDDATSVLPGAPPTPRAEPEDLHGWRKLPGGFYAPPPDPRHTVYVDDNDLRRR